MAATTAVLTLLSANALAVPPSIHPPQLKPMIIVATAPTTTPCSSRLGDSPCNIIGTCMGFPFPLWEKRDFLPYCNGRDLNAGHVMSIEPETTHPAVDLRRQGRQYAL